MTDGRKTSPGKPAFWFFSDQICKRKFPKAILRIRHFIWLSTNGGSTNRIHHKFQVIKTILTLNYREMISKFLP